MSDCLAKLKKAGQETNIVWITVGFDEIIGILEACDEHCDTCMMESEKKRIEIRQIYERMKAEGCPIDKSTEGAMAYVENVPKRSGIACTHYETCYLGKRSIALLKSIINSLQYGKVERRDK